MDYYAMTVPLAQEAVDGELGAADRVCDVNLESLVCGRGGIVNAGVEVPESGGRLCNSSVDV